MQEGHKGTSKTFGRTRRVYNAGTPEVTRKTLLDIRAASCNRMTMTPGDITQIQKPSKEKIAAKRQSVMPLQLSLEAQRKADVECKEVELGLLFNQYLQVVAMDLITRKKTEQKKKLMVTQMAAIEQGIEQDVEKLIKIKERERDIVNLNLAQRELDAHVAAIKKCTNNNTLNTLKRTLSELQCLLEPLDIVKCNGIILPETKEEWQETREIMRKCSDILMNITDLVTSKVDTYCAVNDKLHEFIKTYDEIDDLQKKLKEILCNLQILILKEASLSLMGVNGNE